MCLWDFGFLGFVGLAFDGKPLDPKVRLNFVIRTNSIEISAACACLCACIEMYNCTTLHMVYGMYGIHDVHI